jgi:hypothetical protein
MVVSHRCKPLLEATLPLSVREGLPVIRPESGRLGFPVFLECLVSALAIFHH